jgi:hypothetical protein
MKAKKIFNFLLKMAAATIGFWVLLVFFINWQESFEKYDIAPHSVWVLAVSRDVRQMPTPVGAEIHSYAKKGSDHRLMGFDLARYTWKQNPSDLAEWLSYWKHLGYMQMADSPASWQRCKGLFAFLRKNDLISSIEICHDPETKTTWIEKTP